MRKGFTLIELLIAVTIFAAISTAVYATFNSGMSVWRRAEKFNLEKIRTLIKLEKISRELRKTFYRGTARKEFYGDKRKLYFSAIVNSEVSRITYFFDPDKKIIFKSIDKFADMIKARQKNEKLDSILVPYLAKVVDLSFSYLYFDIKKAAYLWEEDWKENFLPIAIKSNITLGNETYTQTIFIPCA